MAWQESSYRRAAILRSEEQGEPAVSEEIASPWKSQSSHREHENTWSGWTDGDGWTDGWTEGWTDGWTEDWTSDTSGWWKYGDGEASGVVAMDVYVETADGDPCPEQSEPPTERLQSRRRAALPHWVAVNLAPVQKIDATGGTTYPNESPPMRSARGQNEIPPARMRPSEHFITREVYQYIHCCDALCSGGGPARLSWDEAGIQFDHNVNYYKQHESNNVTVTKDGKALLLVTLFPGNIL